MVDDGVMKLTVAQAVGISVAMFVAGWFIYDWLWISPLAKNEPVAVVISYLLIVATSYASVHIFASRAAFMQVGAMLGAYMALNVWVRIIPAQRQLIDAVTNGREPDMRLADRAKQRSKQNTFIVLPVVFIMMSNHFYGVLAPSYNWAILVVLVLIGWGVAKVIRTR